MFQRVRTYCLSGIQAIPVSVEVDASPGLPGFTLVGLPDSAVRESRERVVSAVRSSGCVVTGSRMTVNLSPADLRKEGSSLDLPLAIGMLLASEEIVVEKAERFVFLGELALDGLLKPVRGVLSVAMSLRKDGSDILVIPNENYAEASLVEGITLVGVSSLSECIKKLTLPSATFLSQASGIHKVPALIPASVPDFRSVVGMETVKRALEIAAAGGHNFLLVGSPGAGKTLCARCLPGILPEMSEEEILESTRIHSCVSLMSPESGGYLHSRPFRAPHHSASMVALVGGGARLRPGEASLAHNGVLFLDELPEFNRNVLEALREPMEEGRIQVSRASGSVVWPARFMMGAAMNPCPCGYSMDPKRTCLCLPDAVIRYRQRISGPLMDRIDIQVAVPSLSPTLFANAPNGESSSEMRARVIAARLRQQHRFRTKRIRTNAEMTSEESRKEAMMTLATERFAVTAAEKMMLSARGYYRLLKVARTIADIRSSAAVEVIDLAEALQYRAFSNATR